MSGAVAIDGLGKTFAGIVAPIGCISMVAEAGKITTPLGSNNCGKATTLRWAAGLEAPMAGEIRFADEMRFSTARGIDVSIEKSRMLAGHEPFEKLKLHNVIADELAAQAGEIRSRWTKTVER